MSGATLLVSQPSKVGPHLPRILAEEAVTVLPGAPTVYAALLKQL